MGIGCPPSTVEGPALTDSEKLSAALAQHRILTGLPRMDQFALIERLFEAIKPDFAHLPASVWEKVKADTVDMEQRIPGTCGEGLGFFEPVGNAGAPGDAWFCAAACSEEGFDFKLPGWEWKGPRIRLVVLTLNPPEPKGRYMHRLRTISLLGKHADMLGRSPDAREFMSRLAWLEEIGFGTYQERFVIQMRRFRDWSASRGQNADRRLFVHFEGIYKQTPSLLEIYFPAEFPAEEKETKGYFLGFRDGQTCPVDGEMLWYFDSWLELADGGKGFPAQELSDSERAEVLRLRSARICTKGKRESPIAIPVPFRCFEGHLLWLDPDGRVRAREEESVVDKTADFAAASLGFLPQIPG